MIPVSRPLIGPEEEEAVLAVLRSGMIAQGPEVERFEAEFAALCGTRYAVAVMNGTTALYLALLAHNIGPGDEVITTPFSFIATANSILMTGATPVFVDIDPKTYNINPDLIVAAITSRTRAIMPVHLYGQPADINRLSKLPGVITWQLSKMLRRRLAQPTVSNRSVVLGWGASRSTRPRMLPVARAV